MEVRAIILLCLVFGATAQEPCPMYCACGVLGRHFVICTGEMTEFPKNIPLDTIYLVVEGTNITKIPRGVFSELHNLQDLVLDNNQISAIEWGAFDGLADMSVLSFSSNPSLSLSNVNPLILNDIRNLTVLIAEDNELKTIPSSFFAENKNLGEVILKNAGLTELQPGSFVDLTNLTFVDLSKNQIDHIDANIFTGSFNIQTLNLSDSQVKLVLPHAFETQSEMRYLMLDNNELVSVFSAFVGLKNLLTLTLNDNKILALDQDDFKDLVNLKSLDLSNNNLEETNGALGNLPSLESLNLNNNRLTKLSFEGMPLLTDISVSYNLLTSIPDRLDVIKQATTLDISFNPIQRLYGGQFADLSSLLKLDISNISAIQDGGLAPDALSGLHSLVELRLENNSLSKVPSEAFSAVKQIEVLSLSHNKLTSLDEDDFVSVSKVSNLQLADNLLAMVPETALGPLKNLTQLDLSGNPLVHIPDWSFRNSPMLTSLRLSNAKLEVIDSAAFYGLKSLRSIDITDNQLSWLPGDLLKHLAFPFYLYAVQGNRWNCSCQLKPFSEAVNAPGQPVITEIRCAEPEEYRGRDLREIPFDDLTCDCEHPEAPSVNTSGSDNTTTIDRFTYLRCAVAGCPASNLFWTTPKGWVMSFFVTEYPFYDVRDDGTLVLAYAAAEDAGNYTCTAVNYLGRDEQTHHLEVIPSSDGD